MVDLKLPAAEAQPDTSAQAYQRAFLATEVWQAVSFAVATAAAEAAAAGADGRNCQSLQRMECWQETVQTN